MNTDDCFQILELKSDATLEEIKAARNELLLIWHPDKYASNAKLSDRAQQKTLKINEAYNILVKDFEMRRQKQTSPTKQSAHRNANADFQRELQRYSQKQRSQLKYQEKRTAQRKRAKRQLNFAVLAAFLAGLCGLVLGLKEWAFFLTLVVLFTGLVISFFTYRKPVKKSGFRH
jgi:hypothetical protein